MLTTQQGYEDINKNSEKKAEVLIRPKNFMLIFGEILQKFLCCLGVYFLHCTGLAFEVSVSSFKLDYVFISQCLQISVFLSRAKCLRIRLAIKHRNNKTVTMEKSDTITDLSVANVGRSKSLHVGQEINCNNIDTIQTNNSYSCFCCSCIKRVN